MIIITFHMKMKGRSAYAGHSYMEKMHTLPYFCKNIAHMQAGCIPVMVNTFVAINCINCYISGQGISFPRFPHSKPELLQKLDPSSDRKPNSFICSAHFETLCFEVRVGKLGHKLCNDAVFIIFSKLSLILPKSESKEETTRDKRINTPPSKKAKTYL